MSIAQRFVPVLSASATLLTATAVFAAQHSMSVEQGPKNVPEFEPAFENQTRAPALQSGLTPEVTTIASGLDHPWGVEVLPKGGYLVTERSGALRVVTADGTIGEPISGLPEMLVEKQGGLLDVALGQDFATSRLVYFTYAKPTDLGTSATAAARGVLSEDMTELTQVEDIFLQTPPSPSPMHYGSRIVLDGNYAYVTTGEHFTMTERVYAQDLGTTYGKVVRVTLDGSTPDDNPFVAKEGAEGTVWSYGHRNVQGADIRPDTGQLWTLEHGPQGGDELNLITAGANYGWPEVSYGEQYGGDPVGLGQPRAEGMEEPRYYWDPVIAPGGFAFYDGEMFADWQGDILAASLKPGGMVRLKLEGDTVVGEERFLADQGRIRDVEIDRDGAILLISDKDDGSLLRVTTGIGG